MYSFFDKSDILLYVGRTKNWQNRIVTHGHETKWFRDVRKIVIVPCTSNQQAVDLELREIMLRRPRYNKFAWETRAKHKIR